MDVLSKKFHEGHLVEDVAAVEDLESNKTSGTQIRFMNRYDLLTVIYIVLKDEIDKIDHTPYNDLALLINDEWSHPEVKRRLMWRLENNV